MINKELFKHIDVPFDALMLPSKGLFYDPKVSILYVKYLSALEENILTQPSLMDNGFGLDLVLDSVIINKDIEIDNLLIGDRNSLMIYLRSTAYGDNFPIISECPSCKLTGETNVALSSLGAKDINIFPNELGFFEFTLPKMKLNEEPITICFRPLRVKDEKEIEKLENQEKVKNKKYTSSITTKFQTQIVSINSINNKKFIEKIIKKIPIKDSLALREYMELVEPGIDSNVNLKCPHCSHNYKNFIPINANIFSLDPDFKSALWEEIFLLEYYGKSQRSDIYKMSTVERRWRLQRVSEEIDKKNKAEQAAVSKAK